MTKTKVWICKKCSDSCKLTNNTPCVIKPNYCPYIDQKPKWRKVKTKRRR